MAPVLCGNIIREALNKIANSLGTLQKHLKKARNRSKDGSSESAAAPERMQCELLIDHNPKAFEWRWVHMTSVSITFCRGCGSDQQHTVVSLSSMPNLRRLALFQVRYSESFYGQLARQNTFMLDYFGCDSDITESLVRFLLGQPKISECSFLAAANYAYKEPIQRYKIKPLSRVTLLQTTVPLLGDKRLDFPALRRLEYVCDGNSLDDQIAGVRRICELGPQLETLRFSCDARNGRFLDVIRFCNIADHTPALRHVKIIGVNKDIFEEFVCRGLDRKTWTDMECMVWVPVVPWTVADTTETLSSDGRSIVTISRHHTIPVTLNATSFLDVDNDFRIHRVGRELMDTLPSFQKFAIWNWARKGYDVMERKGMSWNYGVALDEDEWMNA